MKQRSPISRRHVVVPVSGDTLCYMVGFLHAEKGVRYEADLPEDAQFIRWYHDMLRNTLMIVFESKHFREVEEGEELPVLSPMVMVYP